MNCRTTVSEEEIKEAFTKNGFTVKAFKFFPKDRKMALIQMPSMDDAVAALIVSQLFNCSFLCLLIFLYTIQINWSDFNKSNLSF